jgi:hypothetical protein
MAPTVALSVEERDYLSRQLRREGAARAFVGRCAIVLRAAEGLDDGAIADELGVRCRAVRKWRRRFERHRIHGLLSWSPRDFGLVAAMALFAATIWAASVYSHVLGPAAGLHEQLGR